MKKNNHGEYTKRRIGSMLSEQFGIHFGANLQHFAVGLIELPPFIARSVDENDFSILTESIASKSPTMNLWSARRALRCYSICFGRNGLAGHTPAPRQCSQVVAVQNEDLPVRNSIEILYRCHGMPYYHMLPIQNPGLYRFNKRKLNFSFAISHPFRKAV